MRWKLLEIGPFHEGILGLSELLTTFWWHITFIFIYVHVVSSSGGTYISRLWLIWRITVKRSSWRRRCLSIQFSFEIDFIRINKIVRINWFRFSTKLCYIFRHDIVIKILLANFGKFILDFIPSLFQMLLECHWFFQRFKVNLFFLGWNRINDWTRTAHNRWIFSLSSSLCAIFQSYWGFHIGSNHWRFTFKYRPRSPICNWISFLWILSYNSHFLTSFKLLNRISAW